MARVTVFMGSTQIDPQCTIGEITSLLVRARALQVLTDYSNGRVVAVSFALQVPGVPNPVNFRLPCRTERLLNLLRNDKEQAERQISSRRQRFLFHRQIQQGRPGRA